MIETEKILEGLDEDCDYKKLYITTMKIIEGSYIDELEALYKINPDKAALFPKFSDYSVCGQVSASYDVITDVRLLVEHGDISKGLETFDLHVDVKEIPKIYRLYMLKRVSEDIRTAKEVYKAVRDCYD